MLDYPTEPYKLDQVTFLDVDEFELEDFGDYVTLGNEEMIKVTLEELNSNTLVLRRFVTAPAG